MFLLFGETARAKILKQGQFYCPHCQQQRSFEHHQVRSYFTLFFMPLLPLEKLADYVECKSCEHSFPPQILDAERQSNSANASYQIATLRLMLLLGQQLGKTPLQIQALYQTIIEQELSLDEIQQQLILLSQNRIHDPLSELRYWLPYLNSQGRSCIWQATCALLIDENIQELNEQRIYLNRIGSELGLNAQQIQAKIQDYQAL